MFKIMTNMGTQPTIVSFTNAFAAIVGYEDWKSFVILWRLLLKLSADYVSDLAIWCFLG